MPTRARDAARSRTSRRHCEGRQTDEGRV